MNFKVGDRIIKIRDTGGYIKPGQVVTVIKHPEAGHHGMALSIKDHPKLLKEFKDGWCTTTNYDAFVLADVYNSPLLLAMREEEE